MYLTMVFTWQLKLCVYIHANKLKLLLCTLWELCARLLIYFLVFTDQKKYIHANKHSLNCLPFIDLQKGNWMNLFFSGID